MKPEPAYWSTTYSVLFLLTMFATQGLLFYAAVTTRDVSDGTRTCIILFCAGILLRMLSKVQEQPK